MNYETVAKALNVAKKYPYLVRVGVFGSYARGEDYNDIDIIFEYDNSDEEYLDNIDDFMEELETHITTKTDYITFNSLMKDEKSAFREAVLKDVRWLYVK